MTTTAPEHSRPEELATPWSLPGQDVLRAVARHSPAASGVGHLVVSCGSFRTPVVTGEPGGHMT
jgi:hypothetical protein